MLLEIEFYLKAGNDTSPIHGPTYKVGRLIFLLELWFAFHCTKCRVRVCVCVGVCVCVREGVWVLECVYLCLNVMRQNIE